MDTEKRQEICNKIYSMAKKGKSFQEICSQLKLQDYEIAGLITLMHEEGYNIEFANGEIFVLKTPKKNEDIYEIPHASM